MNDSDRIRRARLALEGVALGDAFGQCFFMDEVRHGIPHRELPAGPWFYTDDTMMAWSICDVLAEYGRIDQNALAQMFARRFWRQPNRGYGGGAIRLLIDINRGADWREAADRLFRGEGSLGNGGAMRVAPVGGYFFDDLDRVAREAAASAAVTHAHPEGQAGAITVAVAAALAACKHDGADIDGPALLEEAHRRTPDGQTREGIARVMEFRLDTAPEIVATAVGSGQQIVAYDTVPFVLWCAAGRLDSFEDALWTTAAGLGDVDTTCAMVGGIVALAVGEEGLPHEWLRRREPLEE